MILKNKPCHVGRISCGQACGRAALGSTVAAVGSSAHGGEAAAQRGPAERPGGGGRGLGVDRSTARWRWTAATRWTRP